MVTTPPLPPAELRMGGQHFLRDDDFRSAACADVRRLVAACGLDSDSSVLDVGCGPGRLAIGLLLEFGGIHRYVGVDVQRRHIEWCAENLGGPGFAFVLTDVPNARYNPGGRGTFTLPEDEQFDVVYAYSLLSHMRAADVVEHLRTFRHYLAENGRVFVTAFVEPGVPPVEENPADYGPIEWRGPLHCVRYEATYFRTLVARAGLRVHDHVHGDATDGQSTFVLTADAPALHTSRPWFRTLGEVESTGLRLTALEEAVRELETERSALADRVEELRQQNERRRRKILELRSRLDSSRSAVRARDREIQALQKRLDAAERTLGRRIVRFALAAARRDPRRLLRRRAGRGAEATTTASATTATEQRERGR